ncbi:hypothetical protein [Paenibacillus sp. J5C2022]|uniref:hypothetical protein n=1 Tax=Paenibacillus sp. J5C2022 TaxID=2977129 RepID=UPI0021D0D25E|nr:hypothetical protein [Paenibacillus sp. J5C2022]
MRSVKAILMLTMLMSLLGSGTGWAEEASQEEAAAVQNGQGGGTVPPAFQIGTHNGAPALFVNSEPEFPMFLFEQEISAQDAAVFQDAGVKLYSFIEKTSFLDLGWTGPGQQDFTTVDGVMDIFAGRVTDGYALPRLHLWAPEWWLQQNPAEAVGYAIDPGTNPVTRDASMASQLWRDEAGAMLRAMVRHLLDGPHRNQLMGFTLSAGMYGEWHNWNSEYLPDTSEPMRLAFIEHVKAKYGNDVNELRNAWGDPSVTFQSVTIPTAADRSASDVGLFRDPSLSTRLSDYYEAYQLSVVEAINHFAGIVKDESNGQLIVSVLYGYTPDMGYMPQEVHHREAALAHRLTNVDLLTSPHTYWRRGPGEDGALRTYSDSLALHNKLFIDEADDRTHLAPPGTSFVLASNMAESLGILQRAFGQAVTHATGMWYMDHSSGLWYDAPEIAAEFKRLKHWGDYSMHLPRERNSEVAVISSNQSAYYLGGDKDVSANFYEGPVVGRPQGAGELSKAGAPYDRYLIEDLVEGRIPDRYKVYIFLDTFQLTGQQRAAIESLKDNGRTLVWNWAPGYVGDPGEALSLNRMENLTGFTLQQSVAGGGPVANPVPLLTEDFEGGSLASSSFTGGYNNYGEITSAAGEVVSGSYSAHGEASASTDWYEFLYSDDSEVALEAGATYEVSFKAKTTASPGSDGYFYFLARTGEGGVAQDVGVNSWTDASGASYEKSFTFTLKHFDDYRLIWGLHNGGGLSVDDITITKVGEPGAQPLSYELDSGMFPGETEVYGDTPLDPLFQADATGASVWASSVKDGSPAIVVKDLADWRSVYVSTTPIPAPVLNKLYKDAGVHVFSDSYDNVEANASWISVHAATAGTKTIKLPQPTPVFNIISNELVGTSVSEFQIDMAVGETAIFVLDNPVVSGAMTETFESGSFGDSCYLPGFTGTYGQLTDDPNRVIAGDYSAYGGASASTDWYEFLYSDPGKVVLEAGASYRVDFKAKTVVSPGTNGYFYFLARTPIGGNSKDVGVYNWTDAPGDPYTKSFTFTLDQYDDYKLIWGLHNGGSLSVDDIKVTKLD